MPQAFGPLSSSKLCVYMCLLKIQMAEELIQISISRFRYGLEAWDRENVCAV